jgi:hypothetical protein
MTTKQISKLASEILLQASEYPSEVRGEAIEELVRLVAQSDGLTSADEDAVWDAINEEGW